MLKNDDEKERTISSNERIYCNIEEGYGIGHSEILPLPCYFITTIDKFGNVNTASISFVAPINPRGTQNVTFAIGLDRFGHVLKPEEGNTDTIKNIKDVGELVLSLGGRDLIKELWICGQNFPKGINESEIANLNLIPSRTIKVPSLKECLVNIEGKLDTVRDFDYFSLVLLKVTAYNYDPYFYALTRGQRGLRPKYEERRMPIEAIKMIDPLYELQWDPEVMSLGCLDLNNTFIMRDSNSNAPNTDDFEDWLIRAKEEKIISDEEYSHLKELSIKWEKNPDPKINKNIKDELTKKLKEIVWSKPNTVFNMPIEY
jgi:flavin reductase (DIM6/NTAB) family NADH-FMN oxidoreductase RutF